MEGETSSPLRVIYSGAVQNTLQNLGELARQRGVSEEFLGAVRGLDRSLHTDPLVAGEPAYFLHGLGLQVRIVGCAFFYLRFAVDENRRLAYVLDCVGSSRLGL